jgi:hypothetical protein
MFYGTQIALFLQFNPQQYTLLLMSIRNIKYYFKRIYKYFMKLFTFLL